MALSDGEEGGESSQARVERKVRESLRREVRKGLKVSRLRRELWRLVRGQLEDKRGGTGKWRGAEEGRVRGAFGGAGACASERERGREARETLHVVASET
eukprot:3279294-Rhodomonas_salina.1